MLSRLSRSIAKTWLRAKTNPAVARSLCGALAAFLCLWWAHDTFRPDPVAQAIASGDLIRLHVIANSDSAGDQAIKLKVRDAVLACLRAQPSGESAEAYWHMLEENQAQILSVARAEAERQGFAGDVSLTLGTQSFPMKQYGDYTVPAGDYRALRIVLGSGAGHNWWCVLYPSFCLLEPDAGAAAQAAQPGASAPPKERVVVRSRIFDWICEWFGQ